VTHGTHWRLDPRGLVIDVTAPDAEGRVTVVGAALIPLDAVQAFAALFWPSRENASIDGMGAGCIGAADA